MPYGIGQGALYGMRGLGADGGGIRNRSSEQYNSASGNPGQPIFNTPANAQNMQQRTYTSPTSAMPVNTGAIPMPKFNNGTMGGPGMYGRSMAPATQQPSMPAMQAPAQMPQQQQNYEPSLEQFGMMPQFRWR